jgi:hypothetical protein
MSPYIFVSDPVIKLGVKSMSTFKAELRAELCNSAHCSSSQAGGRRPLPWHQVYQPPSFLTPVHLGLTKLRVILVAVP